MMYHIYALMSHSMLFLLIITLSMSFAFYEITTFAMSKSRLILISDKAQRCENMFSHARLIRLQDKIFVEQTHRAYKEVKEMNFTRIYLKNIFIFDKWLMMELAKYFRNVCNYLLGTCILLKGIFGWYFLKLK